jgi:catechol 2,3-dioxygenase-like lactoylglutathione lyase family enzyme
MPRPTPDRLRAGVQIWYRVSDLDRARDFYVGLLGFQELYRDDTDRWLRLGRGEVELHLAEGSNVGDPEGEAIVSLDVPDVKAEADRLRDAGAEVGTVLEIPSTIRLLDVYDPDGNRLQLSQDV